MLIKELIITHTEAQKKISLMLFHEQCLKHFT